MLSMIPMDIILRYDSLKKAFLSGDILKAVRWSSFICKFLFPSFMVIILTNVF